MIHGKEYFTVAERMQTMKDDCEADYSLETEIIQFDSDLAVVKAILTLPRGSYTGHAFERSDSSQINKTSHLENCETSAIGRALAAAGYAGTEYASANEVQNAIHQQGETPSNVKSYLKQKTEEEEEKLKQQAVTTFPILSKTECHKCGATIEVGCGERKMYEDKKYRAYHSDCDKTEQTVDMKSVTVPEKLVSPFD